MSIETIKTLVELEVKRLLGDRFSEDHLEDASLYVQIGREESGQTALELVREWYDESEHQGIFEEGLN